MSGHVTVEPEHFTFVSYDAEEIRGLVVELSATLGLSNPIHVEVDETNPLAKMSAQLDTASSDSTITLRFQSGALENSKNLQTFDAVRARRSIGRVLLRARDRMRDDFADAPSDRELTNAEHTAWDVYCAGRLAQAGVEINEQSYRYDFRNRFGFSDENDARFDRLWSADDLGWHDVRAAH